MKTFNLTRQVAVGILDSRSFNKVLDTTIKARNVMDRVKMANSLIEDVKTGTIRQRISAIQTFDYLTKVTLVEKEKGR